MNQIIWDGNVCRHHYVRHIEINPTEILCERNENFEGKNHSGDVTTGEIFSPSLELKNRGQTYAKEKIIYIIAHTFAAAPLLFEK